MTVIGDISEMSVQKTAIGHTGHNEKKNGMNEIACISCSLTFVPSREKRSLGLLGTNFCIFLNWGSERR